MRSAFPTAALILILRRTDGTYAGAFMQSNGEALNSQEKDEKRTKKDTTEKQRDRGVRPTRKT